MMNTATIITADNLSFSFVSISSAISFLNMELNEAVSKITNENGNVILYLKKF